jgi:hypothetical protein
MLQVCDLAETSGGQAFLRGEVDRASSTAIRREQAQKVEYENALG